VGGTAVGTASVGGSTVGEGWDVAVAAGAAAVAVVLAWGATGSVGVGVAVGPARQAAVASKAARDSARSQDRRSMQSGIDGLLWVLCECT
jgi:hypothetical protein